MYFHISTNECIYKHIYIYTYAYIHIHSYFLNPEKLKTGLGPYKEPQHPSNALSMDYTS